VLRSSEEQQQVGPVTAWILGDQLLERHPVLIRAEERAGRHGIRVVLVRSRSRVSQQPYHRRKLVLLLSAMRHYAASLRAEGWQVDEVESDDFTSALAAHGSTHGSSQLICMDAAEHATRQLQRSLQTRLGIPVDSLPNTQFLIGQFDPLAGTSGKRTVMETFYRRMRQHFDVLMEGAGAPAGGRWNFDEENRKPLPARIHAPPPFTVPPDAITRQTMAEVAAIPGAIGPVEGFDLPVTRDDALAALADFISHRLPQFGPYEDAMRAADSVLFHSRLSALLNIGLLEPLEVARAAEEAWRSGHAPLNSVEGFIRQIIGWREYIAWQYWRQMPALAGANGWDHHAPLPAFFWTGETDLACLGTVIRRVLATGYSHHIERLMVVCNFAMLAGLDPAAVAHWFLAVYEDAYEWVVLPNVIGMGLNADGGQTATKPYVASANYINRMSDYCRGCRYDRSRRTGPDACPFNTLYWDFMIRNEARLKANPRTGPAVLGVNRIDPAERAEISMQAAAFRQSCGGYDTSADCEPPCEA
jgi:deoxyribodipyrimidine photolyase-related protein